MAERLEAFYRFDEDEITLGPWIPVPEGQPLPLDPEFVDERDGTIIVPKRLYSGYVPEAAKQVLLGVTEQVDTWKQEIGVTVFHDVNISKSRELVQMSAD